MRPLGARLQSAYRARPPKPLPRGGALRLEVCVAPHRQARTTLAPFRQNDERPVQDPRQMKRPVEQRSYHDITDHRPVVKDSVDVARHLHAAITSFSSWMSASSFGSPKARRMAPQPPASVKTGISSKSAIALVDALQALHEAADVVVAVAIVPDVLIREGTQPLRGSIEARPSSSPSADGGGSPRPYESDSANGADRETRRPRRWSNRGRGIEDRRSCMDAGAALRGCGDREIAVAPRMPRA